MLVKKVNGNWQPSENPYLKVGETLEITDPKQLIINGDVVGIADDGVTELSAYELYGVIVDNEMQDYQEYRKVKQAQATQAILEKQNAALEAQVQDATPPAPVAAPAEDKKKTK